MGSLAGIFFGSLLIGFSGAAMPGPMFVVVVGQSPRRGVWAGPLVVLGHAALESALVVGVTLGLAELLSAPTVVTAIAVLGALVLLYMGVDMLLSAGRLTLYGEGLSSGNQGPHPVLAGVLTSLANPYWTIWWATIGLGYMLLAREAGAAGLAAFLAGHLLADLIWYTAVSSLVAGGKRWLTDGIYRGMIRVLALGLLFFAFYFGWNGINGIDL